jgi:hypothetical protein
MTHQEMSSKQIQSLEAEKQHMNQELKNKDIREKAIIDNFDF